MINFRFTILASLILLSGSAHALVSSDPAFDRFISTVVSNKTTVGFASNGTALAKASVSISAANGGLQLARNIPFAAGSAVVDVVATQAIRRTALATMFRVAAVGLGATTGIGGVIALAALPYVVDYLKDSKIRPNPNGTANSSFEYYQEYPSCTDCSLYTYSIDLNFAGVRSQSGPQATASLAAGFVANSIVEFYSSNHYGNIYIGFSCTDISCLFSGGDNDSSGHFNDVSAYITKTLKPSAPVARPPEWVPIQNDVLDSYLSKSTAPLDPNILPALVSATGVDVVPDSADKVNLSGPSESAPFNTVQATKVDPTGTTTENSECIRHFVYDTSSVSLEDVCSVSTNNPDGTVKKTATTTPVIGNTPLVDGAKNDQLSDKPILDVEAQKAKLEADKQMDICTKMPDILACQKLVTPASEIVPKTSKTITYTPDNSFGSGSCPADKTMTVNGRQLKVVDWTSHCGYIATYLRPILILLASYMALMMLIPGRSD